jgi:alpha-mannosidase
MVRVEAHRAMIAGMTEWRLHVVPHTHWDREWYLPLEPFRIRLAETLDEVLDVLDADPRMWFELDGQSVILDDYREYRPHPRAQERLRSMLATGRLSVGPAYVQPDELLVGGESLVRNLLVGMAVCQRYGARPAPIGYAPDAFGHVAQMPQILRGFGLDHLIFTRGLGEPVALAWWEGPDGSRVLAIPQSGTYGSASSLGMEEEGGRRVTDPDAWPAAAATRVRGWLDRFGPAHESANLHEALLCNGVDHRRIQRNLHQMLDAVVERIPEVESYRVCRYEDYVATVRARLDTLRLMTITGELVSGRLQRVTRGVNSTRIELKQANAEVEQLLQSSETLAALASLRGYRYPGEALEVAWRHLLRAQPHDSIAGCSVDQVHRDMRHRFDVGREIGERIGQEALAALAGAGRDAIWHWAGAPGLERSLVNVLPWPRRCAVELALPAPHHGRYATRGDLPVQVLRGGAALVVADLPALGSVPLELVPGAEAVAGEQARVTGARKIENRFLRVIVAANGTLTLTERATGRRWSGLHRFEDQADRGDEYTFCPLEGETPWTSADATATVRVVERGPLRAELEVRVPLPLPAGLAADRRRRVAAASCLAVTRVRLEAGIDRVELVTRIVNRASDHRLRVRFPDRTGDPARIRAQSAFAVVERPARTPDDGTWVEPPAPTHHTGGLVCAGELVVMTRGLPEYEAIPRRRGIELAITLLRAVGWLARDDLPTRPGVAGPAIRVPDAQGLGERVCEYALSLRGAQGDAELVRATEDYRFAAADGPGGIDLGGLLDVAGERFACSALKGAEDGEGLILRVFNPGREPGWIAVGRPAERCRLDETGGTAIRGRVELGPYEIVTLRLR